MKEFVLPNRFEKMNNSGRDFERIIVRVDEALDRIVDLRYEMKITGGGAFLILKGRSGVGKTTFLNTLHMFIDDIEMISIEPTEDLQMVLDDLNISGSTLRIIVLENRESYTEISFNSLEKDIRAINKFVRKDEGERNLIIWPCNGEEMVNEIKDFANNIGGTSIMDEDTIYEFTGPPKEDYLEIVKNTFEFFNYGRSLLEFGVSDEYATKLINECDSIGTYLKTMSKKIRKFDKNLDKFFIRQEMFRMWIIVISGDDPIEEVNYFTKGSDNSIDIKRVIEATFSNTSIKLKQDFTIGLLANKLDCRILHIPISIALSIIKSTEEDDLKNLLNQNGINCDIDKKERLKINSTSLADSLSRSNIKHRKNINNTQDNVDEFVKITSIASNNDRILNREIGKALVEQNLIYQYEVESKLAGFDNRRSDLKCNISEEIVRLEFMWRKKTTYGEIANYTLNKLKNYGSAIGFYK
ncbi:hypothetical protein [Clostridium intestinale]|uniref:DNA (Cytosine-5)-methyltransferase 1 n=1 Tax=Clostridium intestinale DSM 6191 TaxID=1121320 RepID=A0A1M6AKH3_9CLOT|nr:hypothetical protein [Clostridium intestinale]SHI36713.1 DNA (cytosine-5)-methyltransferase 1 [Clostridium intestinale DSM 6191]